MSIRFIFGFALALACLPKVEIDESLREDGGAGAAGSNAAGPGTGGTGGDATSTGFGGAMGVGGAMAAGGGAGDGGAGVGGAGVGGAGTGGAGTGGAGTGGAGTGGAGMGGAGRGGAGSGGVAGSGGRGGASGSGGAGGSTGGSATGGGGTGGNTCVGAASGPWADWPMPNSVMGGLPNPQSYDTSVSGVVRDNVTGLVWQRATAGALYKWADAQSFCANLVLGGCDQWRLPTRIELVSIVDYSKRAPAIDTAAFPNTPQEGHWTVSAVAAKPIDRWWINFSTGEVHDDGDVNAGLNVRCVH